MYKNHTQKEMGGREVQLIVIYIYFWFKKEDGKSNYRGMSQVGSTHLETCPTGQINSSKEIDLGFSGEGSVG
jgi:hypothetical protein